MELRNKRGETAQLADNLTLKEVVDMGFSVDICDKAYDPEEHWLVDGNEKSAKGEFPES